MLMAAKRGRQNAMHCRLLKASTHLPVHMHESIGEDHHKEALGLGHPQGRTATYALHWWLWRDDGCSTWAAAGGPVQLSPQRQQHH